MELSANDVIARLAVKIEKLEITHGNYIDAIDKMRDDLEGTVQDNKLEYSEEQIEHLRSITKAFFTF